MPWFTSVRPSCAHRLVCSVGDGSKMHADGEHITAIAEIMGVACSTLYRALKPASPEEAR